MQTAAENKRVLEDTLIIATHNEGKVREMQDLLGGKVATIQSAGELGLDDPEETGTTFHANAALKAVAAAEATGKIALADDSGLAVEALNGDPGIYSARWAEDENGHRDWDYGMQKIWDQIKDQDNMRATFVTVLALAWPDGHVEYIEGNVHGTIVWPKRGDNGFGYDPLFYVPTHDCASAELPADVKNSLSHRGQALRQFQACWKARS